MGIIATNMVNTEGQSGTDALMRAVSNTQANVDFATELDHKLQVKTSPADTSIASIPELASAKGNSSSPPASSSLEPHFELIEVSGHEELEAPSATTSVLAEVNATTGPVPAGARSVAPRLHATNALSPGQIESANVAGSSPGLSDSSLIRSGSALQASIVPARAEYQPAGSGFPKGCGVNPRSRGNESDPPGLSAINNTSGEPTVETPVQHNNVATQLLLLQPSSGADHRSEASQYRDSKAPSESHKSTYAAGPALDQIPSVPAANPPRSSRVLQGAAVATLPPLQNATTELQMPEHSSEATAATALSKYSKASPSNDISPKWKDDAASLSRLSKGSQSTAAETTAPAPDVTAESEVQSPTSGMDALDARSASRPNAASSNAPLKIDTSLRNVPAELESHNPSSDYDPKSAPSQDEGSMASSASQRTPTDANTTSGPLEIAQLAGTGRAELGSAGGLDPAPDPAITIIETRDGSMGKGLQNAGMEPTLSNPRNSLRTVGPEAPPPQAATHSEPQAPSSALQSDTTQQAESSAEPALRSHDYVVPDDGDPTILSAVPDPLPSGSFGLTLAALPMRGKEPANSSRTNDSQGRSNAAPGSSSDAVPDIVPGLVAQGPAQTQDKGADPSASDTKQLDASNNKKELEAVLDLAKTADPSRGLSKAGADPPFASQFGDQGRVEVGSVSPEAVGVPQGRSEPDSAPPLAGYQSMVHGAVSSARLTQQGGSAEMQVRLRTEALGPIDVHTIVKGSEIGASIRVEARDTQVMMANELSRLEQALNERNLRVQRLDVLQGSVSGSQSGGTGPGNYHGNPSGPRPNHASLSVGQTYPALPECPPVYEEGVLELSTTRINLRV